MKFTIEAEKQLTEPVETIQFVLMTHYVSITSRLAKHIELTATFC